MAKVDIVKVKNPTNFDPQAHHAVEEEITEKVLHECGTQAEAMAWAVVKGYTINVHRERNRKPSDRHGQFRKA